MESVSAARAIACARTGDFSSDSNQAIPAGVSVYNLRHSSSENSVGLPEAGTTCGFCTEGAAKLTARNSPGERNICRKRFTLPGEVTRGSDGISTACSLWYLADKTADFSPREFCFEAKLRAASVDWFWKSGSEAGKAGVRVPIPRLKTNSRIRSLSNDRRWTNTIEPERAYSTREKPQKW
jgi:hypothetical protein